MSVVWLECLFSAYNMGWTDECDEKKTTEK